MSEKEEEKETKVSKFQSFRVDFNFPIIENASMYVIAETEEAAKEGCRQMLAEADGPYQNAEIVRAEVVRRQDAKAEPVLN